MRQIKKNEDLGAQVKSISLRLLDPQMKWFCLTCCFHCLLQTSHSPGVDSAAMEIVTDQALSHSPDTVDRASG